MVFKFRIAGRFEDGEERFHQRVQEMLRVVAKKETMHDLFPIPQPEGMQGDSMGSQDCMLPEKRSLQLIWRQMVEYFIGVYAIEFTRGLDHLSIQPQEMRGWMHSLVSIEKTWEVSEPVAW